MSLNTKSVPRHAFLDGIAAAIERCKRDGGRIAAHAEAKRLLAEGPYCSMSAYELRAVVARRALDQGVGVDFGPLPGE